MCAGVGSGRLWRVPESSGEFGEFWCWCRFRRQVPEGSGGFRKVLWRMAAGFGEFRRAGVGLEAGFGRFQRVPVVTALATWRKHLSEGILKIKPRDCLKKDRLHDA